MEDRSLLILYGSETGCAQDVAENLGRQARRRHFNTKVYAMDEYDKSQLLDETIVIFVCSTTGQGAEPTNMKRFWRFLLRKNLPNDILSNIDCAVIGLGDSSYRKFNYPAKKLYRRLIQLGANMVIDRADCDDQHYQGLDGAFIPWAKKLWNILLEKYPTKKPILSDDVLLPPNFKMEFLSEDEENNHKDTRCVAPQKLLPGEFNLTVKENKRITATDHFQDVRHIEVTCEDEKFHYDPGDIAVIPPQNLPGEVDLFLEFMGWTEHADKIVRFIPSSDNVKLPTHWPDKIRFKDIFIYHLDLFGVPRRSFFEMLAYFATDDLNHAERLREFASPEGQEDMWAYSARPRRTIAEVLYDFQPFHIPFDYILDLFPSLQPRSFSIASCLEVHAGNSDSINDSVHTKKKEMQLFVAVVKYKTKMRRIRRGVFTKWLSTWQPGDTIARVRILKGTMSLPPSSDIPLIAIGPGTGLAPMRSFLEHRIEIQQAKENMLILGCRHHDKDYYYREQWERYVERGQLVLFTAFSRDQEQKVYVQDKIRENGKQIWDWIEHKQAKVVLSGSMDKMPGQVAFAFKEVFMKEGGLNAEEAEIYFGNMTKTGQYQEECWN
ncbi:hypothetical protein BDF20DRAFT_817613 [Mycotypha africana]|uniref:uncharacterized protein n=1 Tax=Mycotypha africana TaxID=64632 RepID=UPI00230113F2|nr:uncharacterized protein BDF20DRAFT_817613 [Mycotypha africana]KAI8982269.1 hypothetical protein BDF20DRAFT_817613 [Mycotypha africana]